MPHENLFKFFKTLKYFSFVFFRKLSFRELDLHWWAADSRVNDTSDKMLLCNIKILMCMHSYDKHEITFISKWMCVITFKKEITVFL